MGDWFEQAKKDYVPGVFGYRQIAKKYGISVKTVESRFLVAKKKGIIIEKPIENLQDSILRELSKGCAITYLCDKYKSSERVIRATIEDIQELGYDIEIIGNNAQLRKVAQEENKIHNIGLKDGWHRAGVVSDTHLNSKYQQLTHLRNTYETFEHEGVEFVLHSGDITAGKGMYKGQEYEVINLGADEQCEYIVQNYPQIPNVKTKLIAGNHDLSYYNSMGFDICKQVANRRDDIEYLGQLGAYVEVAEGVYIYLLHPDSGQCFDDKTEIMTKNGWKQFKELTMSDEVATMTKERHEFQWQKPTHITNEYYNGKMYRFKGRCLDMVVTPNHGMWARINKWRNKQKKNLIMPLKSHRHEDYQWKRVIAQEIVDGYCRQKWQLTNHCNGWEGKTESEYVKIPYIECKSKGSKMRHIGEVHISDLSELIAWYVTEGYCNEKLISISQSKTVNPDNHKRITDLLDRIGIVYSVKGEDGKDINIYNVELAAYLKEICGKGSINKKIPNFIKGLPPKYLKKVLEILILGDGWINGKSYGYRSISRQLRDDVSEIAIKCGYGVTFSGDTVNVSVIQNEPTINIKPEEIEYKGKIYCCEVSNGLILVRRNGKATWSHNSYAVSYKPQKIAAGFVGGQKPNIMIIGHYHQAEYLFERNIHIIQAGCFEAQTPYLKRKGIMPKVGGWMIEFKVDGGSVTRFKQELITYFRTIDHDY